MCIRDRARTSLFLALLRKVILLVPLALILPRVTGSVMGIYAAEPIADIQMCIRDSRSRWP